MTADRESSHRLEGCSGEELWKVASEPEYGMVDAVQNFFADGLVDVPA